jgi:hypothetical protein
MFKSIVERKRLIDKEVELYKREKMLDAEKELVDIAMQCARDTGSYEHEYHSKIQELQVDIAKLEAQKGTYQSLLEERISNYVAEYKAVNAAKDRVIATLESTIELMAKNVQTSNIINN